MHSGSRNDQQGFVYVAMLFALAVLGFGLAKIGQATSMQVAREREDQLLRAGADIVRAIASYHAASPSAVRAFPAALSDLVEDRRFVVPQRHIRRIPLDPVTLSHDWELLLTKDGTIQGVRSRSTLPPVSTVSVRRYGLTLQAARQFADWRFVYEPDTALPGAVARPR